MSVRVSLQTRIDDYLVERRRLGFELRSRDTFLASFARFVASRRHRGPLTVELMTQWVRQGKGGQVRRVKIARSTQKRGVRVTSQLEDMDPDVAKLFEALGIQT